MRKCCREGPCITVSVYAVATSTRSWNWSSVLHHTHKGGAAFVQMCVCVCAFVTYWVECGLQLCLIIFNFSLHRLHISWTVSAFQSHLCCPCCSPLPVLVLSPPSRRPLKSPGQRQTLRSSTCPMSPLTASWRNILLPWSCFTPLVSKRAKEHGLYLSTATRKILLCK